MMKFILIADDEKIYRAFFPWWQVLILFLVVSLVFFILFPRHLLNKTLSYTEPSPAVLNYLQAFSAQDPKNVELKLRTIEQEVGLGLIEKARENAELLKKNSPLASTLTQLRWIDFLILRYDAYHSKLNTTQRVAYLQQLRQKTAELANANLSPQQLKTIAKTSLNVAQTGVALEIYNRLFKANELTPDDLIQGAGIALQNNTQQDTAKFYNAVYAKAKTQADKKKYGLEVVKALWAANKVQDAYSFSQQLPMNLINDSDTLLFLSRLSIAADHPEIAEKYAIKALLMKANSHHE